MIDPHTRKATVQSTTSSRPGSTTFSRPSGTRLAEYLALRQVHWDAAYLGLLIFFVVTTTYIANVGTEAMVMSILALAFGPRRVWWPLPVRLLLAFLVWAALSTVLSQYPGDIEPVVTFGKVLLVFLVSVNVLRHPTDLRIFVLLYVICFVLFPARGTMFNYFIYQNADFGRPAWRDSFDNPNDMAALTILALSLAASFLHKGVPRIVRYAALLTCLILPVIILMTQSRAAFIGMAVFILLSVLSSSGNRIRTLAAVIAIGAIAIVAAPKDVWQRIAGLKYATSIETISIMDPEGSAGQRWEIWETGFHVISDHLVLGVGLGRYEQANFHYNPSLGRKDIHNTYLEILAETGVPGFLLFFWLLTALVIRARRARRNAYALRDTEEWHRLKLLEIGLYGYFVAGIWGTYAFLSLLYIYLAIFCAQTEVLDALAAQSNKDNVIRAEKKLEDRLPQPGQAGRRVL